MTRNSIVYFISRGGGGLLTVLTLAVFTRILSPPEYGWYALGVTLFSITAALVFQWLAVAVARFYPAFADRPGVLLAASLRGFGLSTLIAVAGFLAAIPIGRARGASFPFLVCVLLATVVGGLHALVLQVANSQGRPLRFAMLTWVRALFTLIAGALFVLLGVGYVGALLGWVAGAALSMIVVNPLRGVRPQDSAEARELSPKLFRYGMPLIVTLLGMSAVDYADRLIIAGQLGAGAVGHFAAVYDLTSQTITAMTSVLFLAGFPAVANAFEKSGEEAARNQMRLLGRSLLVVALPITIGFGAVSRDVAHVMLGPSFRGEVTLLIPIIAGAVWLSGFRMFYLDVVFQLHKVTAYLAWIAVTMMVVNIGLNFVLLPIYGIAGAAGAKLGAWALGALLSFFLGRGFMRLPSLGDDFVRAALATGCMVAVLIPLKGASGVAVLVAKVALGAATYFVAAWLLNVAGIRSWLSARLLPTR